MGKIKALFQALILSLLALNALASGTYYSASELLAEVFPATDVASGAVWMTLDRKAESADLFGSALPQARFRYQTDGESRLWLLSEIGKEKPISYGVVTQGGKIVRIEVMVFRESRGDEIRLPQYTAQYEGLTLTAGGDLSTHVDGISGATYSVRSMKKVAKIALLLDRWATADNAAKP